MNIDWYPLVNSLRIAAISCVLVFFTGIFFAYYAAKLPRTVKGVLDVILTLPMVLPPTVCGYFLLHAFGVKRPLGIFLAQFGVKFVMTWYGGVLAAAVVAFPLMYRTARGAFETIIQFRYVQQSPESPSVWWRLPKDKRPQQFPPEMGSPLRMCCCCTNDGGDYGK